VTGVQTCALPIYLDPQIVSDLHALIGGEDHGMLAAFPEAVEIPEEFLVIGKVLEVVAEAGTVTLGGVDPEQAQGGWDPYRRGEK
jgi:thiamine-monophosphate kinase